MPRLSILIVLACLAFPVAAQSNGSQFTTFAGFELGKVTLGEITKSLGSAKLIENGDAGEYVAKICYRAPTGLVYFLSGEMGGRNRRLLGFGVSSSAATQPCSTLPSSHAPKTLNIAGLQLGQTKAEFSRVVSTPIQWEGNIGRSFMGSKRPMTPTEMNNLSQDVKKATMAGQMQNYFDVVVSIEGTFSGDKLIEFKVWKVETL